MQLFIEKCEKKYSQNFQVMLPTWNNFNDNPSQVEGKGIPFLPYRIQWIQYWINIYVF